MTIIERFRSNIIGGIKFTGNSLVVAKKNEPSSFACAFITVDSSKQADNFPLGTTENFVENSSSAKLELENGCDIVYAELIWGGIYKAGGRGLSEPTINNSVKLTLPNKTSVTAVPDYTTRFNSKISEADGVYCYTRSAPVTNWLKLGGSGFYTVSGVPAYINKSDKLSQDYAAAGWTLAVIYSSKCDSCSKKHICLYVGNLPISDDGKEKGIAFRYLYSPVKEDVDSDVLLSAVGGNFYLSPTKSVISLSGRRVALSGKNNRINNFFASQINTNGSFPDLTGTFGNSNFSETSSFGRKGWDITDIDIKKYTYDNSGLILKFAPSANVYSLNAAAISITIEQKNKGYNLKTEKAVLCEETEEIKKSPIAQGDAEIFSQPLVENIYSYNIKKLKNCEIQYNSAKVLDFGSRPILLCSYTIVLTYLDSNSKTMTSVKMGSISLINISELQSQNCSVRITPNSAKVSENTVTVRAAVKVLKK